MCQKYEEHHPQTVKFTAEVIAPCGEVVMIKTANSMREIENINGEELIKNARLFFRNLGFGGDEWKVKVTKKTFQHFHNSWHETTTEKVFC